MSDKKNGLEIIIHELDYKRIYDVAGTPAAGVPHEEGLVRDTHVWK